MNWKLVAILAISISIITSYVFASDSVRPNHSSPLGFEFGSSHKEVEKQIENSGHRIIENTKDSKKMRTILAEGAFVQLPIDTDLYDVKTRLEFWNKDLMASTLIVEDDNTEVGDYAIKTLLNYIVENYGKPSSTDKFMDFTTITWQLSDLSILLSSNAKKMRTKLEFTYKPLNAKRKDHEYDKSQRVDTGDPAKQMFLEGGLDSSENQIPK